MAVNTSMLRLEPHSLQKGRDLFHIKRKVGALTISVHAKHEWEGRQADSGSAAGKQSALHGLFEHPRSGSYACS